MKTPIQIALEMIDASIATGWAASNDLIELRQKVQTLLAEEEHQIKLAYAHAYGDKNHKLSIKHANRYYEQTYTNGDTVGELSQAPHKNTDSQPSRPSEGSDGWAY